MAIAETTRYIKSDNTLGHGIECTWATWGRYSTSRSSPYKLIQTKDMWSHRLFYQNNGSLWVWAKHMADCDGSIRIEISYSNSFFGCGMAAGNP